MSFELVLEIVVLIALVFVALLLIRDERRDKRKPEPSLFFDDGQGITNAIWQLRAAIEAGRLKQHADDFRARYRAGRPEQTKPDCSG